MSKNGLFLSVFSSDRPSVINFKIGQKMSKCDELDLDIAELDIVDLDMGLSFRDFLDIAVVGHTSSGHKKLDIFVMTPKGFRAVK